jgi:hypothetical protein
MNPDDGDSNEDEDQMHDAVEQVYNVSDCTQNGVTEPHSQANPLTHNHGEVQNPDSGDGLGQGQISSFNDKLKKLWSSLLNLDSRSIFPKSLSPSPDLEMTTVAV